MTTLFPTSPVAIGANDSSTHRLITKFVHSEGERLDVGVGSVGSGGYLADNVIRLMLEEKHIDPKVNGSWAVT